MAKSRSSAAKKTGAIMTDVIVVGGGPSGCSMAALLAANGVEAVCIDRDDPAISLTADFDGRTTAISFGSQRVIAAAGAWETLSDKACAIEDIHITESGAPTLLRFLVKDVGEKAFGWIVENRHLRQSLFRQLADLPRATHLAPATVARISEEDGHITAFLEDGRCVQGKILIGADGRNSFVRAAAGIDTRGWSYNQRALVCVVAHEQTHGNTALEDFRPQGPFAALPMLDDENGIHRSALVWTEHGPERQSALHWDEASFNAALSERFPARYGHVRLMGKRFSYPLGLVHAHSYTAPRLALIADAAHGIHPIAGQGLNMGLRDVADLAERLIMAKRAGEDPGSAALLDAYERARRGDNMAMAAATNALNRLFSNDIAPVRIARRIGLSLVGKMPPVQRFFMKQAMGSSGSLPALIRTGKFQFGQKP